MDVKWMLRNVARATKDRATWRDGIRHLVWLYSKKIPFLRHVSHYKIGFRYPSPVGTVEFVLRNNSGADAFIHSEVFEHGYYNLPLARKPETVLDLGANIGLTTVFFARCFPGARIACVEPAHQNVQLLKQNLALNMVTAMIFEGAVDAQDGMLMMDISGKDYGHYVATAPAEANPALVEVRSYSVKSIINKLGWKSIGLLKMDIEGHERRLLSDGCEWLDVVESMCIEWHYDDAFEFLNRLALRHGFSKPIELPGVWLLTRT